jgi:hypothetical protein
MTIKTVALAESTSVVLDSNGNGTIALGPTGFGGVWTQVVASVRVATNTAEATCLVTVGPENSPQYFADGTTWGSTGDSTSNIQPSIPTGQSVYANWAGGDPGATAYLNLTGLDVYAAPDDNTTGLIVSASGGSFAHDIAGGNGNLIITSLQSPNFESGISGWQISKNGNAQFNSLIIRGIFLGFNFELTPAGLFFYSGALPSPLNSNPYFANASSSAPNPAGWNASNGFFGVAASPPAGAPYLYAGVYINNGVTVGAMEEGGAPTAITPGDQYVVSAWVYSNVTAVQLGFNWTENGTFVSSSTQNITVPVNTWTLVSATLTAPASGVNGGYPRLGTTAANSGMIVAQAVSVYAAGAATLLYSITGADGTDQFGNPYFQGMVAYGTSGGYAALKTVAGETGLLLPPGGTTSSVTPPSVFSFNENPGAVNEFAAAVLYSGTETLGGNAAVQVYSQAADGSTSALGVLEISGVRILAWSPTLITANMPILFAGSPQAQTSGGFTGSPVLSQTDNTSQTVTQAVFTRLSKVWNIPANDPNAGTVYRLTAAGHGTTGTAQQVLNLGINAFGISPVAGGTFALPIGSVEFPVSTTFSWRLQADIYVASPGTGNANIAIGMSLTIGVSGANQLTNANTANSGGGFASYSSANTGTTTALSNITLQAEWGAVAGAPTITCNYSVLERMGT